MTPDRIELRLIEMPLVAPFETSFGVEHVEEHIIVRIEAQGIEAWGECVASNGPWYSYETTRTEWHILREFLIPMLLSADVRSPRDFPKLVARVRGHNMAKAGLEAALWDWFGKEQGMSLAALFGAKSERIAVGVSIGLQPTTEALVERVEGYLAQGYGRVKIKIKPGRDLELVRAVRANFPDLRLQVDANSAYGLDDADIFREMDECNLLLIEQPLGADDIYQHSLLQNSLKTPLCLDESIHSLSDAEAALAVGACRIINIKPGRVGGFTEAIRIHDACLEKGAPVWCGGMLESGIGRAGNVAMAALPNFKLPGDLSASRRYYHEDLVEPEFEIEPDGTMRVPMGAGIGVQVLEKRLEQYSVESEEFVRRKS